ncbi:sorbosone dehydrogenase family protein [Archangium violaceum]|uniref:PQQ-dependent sugar dehydrogenase n=1 Tax=Archangium violaceum TaxID=83451 RepID=UPI00194FD312|nr:PQQ-dependent sugar dehydrogenase [Archangium violaceum]QRN97972.1 sorbosone dehydrogenase family protein [Archangium violaceum]
MLTTLPRPPLRWLPLLLTLACSSSSAPSSVRESPNTPGQEARVPTPQVPPTQAQVRAVSAENNLVRPARRDFNDERLRQLSVRPGFSINVFAQGLTNPRVLAVRPDGTVYVTEREAGRVTLLRDTNGDGRADQQTPALTGLGQKDSGVHGLALRGNQLYLVTVKQLYVADIRPDGTLATPRELTGDLPDGGQHGNRTLAFGPDGRLYLSVGSTCNACAETDPEHATLLRVDPTTGARSVFAKGLRNTIGFAWHPATGQLWGMDHGSDSRGDDFPPEELNRLEEGGDYGWPFCAGKQEVDPFVSAEPPNDLARPDYCARTKPSTLEYQGHSAPMTLTFYTGSQFPAEFRNDAFLALRGSWNRNPPTGYKLVRIRFDPQGNPLAFEDFVSGWLLEDGRAHFGRLVGTAVATDGSLLVTDDTNGIIYRIAYTGG